MKFRKGTTAIDNEHRGAALIVESEDLLGIEGQVGDKEAHARQ